MYSGPQNKFSALVVRDFRVPQCFLQGVWPKKSINTPPFGQGFPFPFRLLGPEGVVTLGEAMSLPL